MKASTWPLAPPVLALAGSAAAAISYWRLTPAMTVVGVGPIGGVARPGVPDQCPGSYRSNPTRDHAAGLSK